MLKTLWIMRHGLAENQFDSDFSRQLSQAGKEQALDVAKQIKSDSDNLPTAMLVSPFARTQATATIVHKELALIKPFETDEMLVHFADHRILGDFLPASDYENLIIVSHMPIVAELCQYLMPGCSIYGFQTAQAVRLNFDVATSENEGPQVALEKVYLPR
jgi:phosphohistidine phosphatase